MRLKKQTSKNSFNNINYNKSSQSQTSPNQSQTYNDIPLKQTLSHSLLITDSPGIALTENGAESTSKESQQKLARGSTNNHLDESNFSDRTNSDALKEVEPGHFIKKRSNTISNLVLTPISSSQTNRSKNDPDPFLDSGERQNVQRSAQSQTSSTSSQKVGAYIPPHRLNQGTPSSLSPFTPYHDHQEDETSFYSAISSNVSSPTLDSPSSFSDRRKSVTSNHRPPPQLKRLISRTNPFVHPETLLDPFSTSTTTKFPITIMDDRSQTRIELEVEEESESIIGSDCPASIVDEEDFDYSQSGNVLMSRKQRSLLEALDLPSPVWEVDESQDQETEINQEEEEEDNDVCTGCGTLPVASFVAMIPCDHLVCHTCLNALINSAAHTPPRPMVCFACGVSLDSFGPAFEEEQGGLGMVNNLLASLKNRESVRVEDEEMGKREEKIDLGDLREKDRKGKKSVHSNNSINTNMSGWRDNFGRQDYSNTTNIQDYKFGLGFSSSGIESRRSSNPILESSPFPTTPHETRNSSFASSGGISTPHIVSPLSLKYSTSNSNRKVPLRTPGGSSSVAKEIMDGNSAEIELSPFRKLDWSVETENSPRVNDWRSTSPVTYRNVPTSTLPHKIPTPIEWTVVRIDNIPWDVSVPELEEWLPKDSLAPSDDCVLPVHILCNRADGRTLNQCYIETASLTTARNIVRTRDGKKLRGRPVHVTLSNQSQLMSEIFPGWSSGFHGLRAIAGKISGPLLVQTELTGLLALCKLQTNHAYKVKERPYYNIVTILQKFPWHQFEAYNDKQIVRLFNTSCAAVEILSAVRNEVPEWVEILTTMVAAVTSCPVFRLSQKTKFVQLTGLSHSKYAYTNGLQSKYNLPQGRAMFDSTNVFSFSPPSLKEAYVTVEYSAAKTLYESENDSPSKIFNVLPPSHRKKISSLSSSVGTLSINPSPGASPQRLNKSISTPNLFMENKGKNKSGSPVKRRPRRVSSISRQFGIEIEMVKAVALELGITIVS